jgi:hypothetical protein
VVNGKAYRIDLFALGGATLGYSGGHERISRAGGVDDKWRGMKREIQAWSRERCRSHGVSRQFVWLAVWKSYVVHGKSDSFVDDSKTSKYH